MTADHLPERIASEQHSVLSGLPPQRSTAFPGRAERRQLTIMFCDLVDSVKLSGQLDPEDLRDVTAAYQRACAESIQRYGGYVSRYVGDGILALFGYPAAHEDDAERAVRASLEVVEKIPKLKDIVDHLGDEALRVRIGIATGLVVVGDVSAEGVSEKDAVAGEASNLAARLQGLASPNSIVVSSLTRQLAEGFEYRDLGARELKGFAKPISVYQVIGERDISRLEARAAAPTPFVGREKEIELLLDCWKRASSGSGQVVVISGEAGIGKSRIAAELCARIRRTALEREAEASSPLIFQCSPYHANSPLYPILRQLERLSAISRSDPDRDKLDKLEALFGARNLERRQAISLVADLLGLKPDERCTPISVGRAVKRHLAIEALMDWCISRATHQTLPIIFEDVQWIDPTSKLFLSRLVDWAKSANVLVAITLRISGGGNVGTFLEEAGLGAALSHVTVCEIGELGNAEVKQLAAAMVKGGEIPQRELDSILKKTEGIPLYVEELVKAALNGIDSSHADGRVEEVAAVPNTISNALMAQLDQLGHAKEIAQYASVIGQEFSISLLAQITTISHSDLIPALDRLANSRIIIRGAPSSNAYRFRHALIRDISYQTLLRRSRRNIHLRIATELSQRATETIEETYDLIAQHYSLGGSYSKAIEFWQKGAKNAIARSAHEEALGMITAALADYGKLRGEKSASLELDLVLAQAMALRSIHGYAAPDVEQRLIRGRHLCGMCEDNRNRFSVEWGLFQCTIVKGDMIGAHQLANALFEHARSHPDRPLVDAYLANGMVAFHLGDFEGAKTFFEKGVELTRPDVDEPHFFTHGQNPGLFCLSYLARTQCFLGLLDQGRATVNHCLAIARARARDPGHIYGYVNALIHAVRVYHFCGDIDAERRLAGETMDISRRNHYAYYAALSMCHLGWIVGATGHLSEGISQMVDGIAAVERTGTLLALPGFYILLAQLYVRANLIDEAERALVRTVGPNGSTVWLWASEIERVRGELFGSRPHPNLEAAEASYYASLAIARRQNARSLALKTGLSLTRLLQRMDRRSEGHKILTNCLEQLHEGMDTEDVRTAQAAVRDLAGTDCHGSLASL